MRKDYHMHPTIIQNPARFDDFAQHAIDLGISEVCITDHMPLSISDAADRIPAGCIAEYCRRVREIARRYEGRLTVRCGIEIDYHPSAADEIDAVLSAGDFDYVLASSHIHVFTPEKDMPRYTWNDFASMALENLARAVDTGLFSAVAHFDMYRWCFTEPDRFPLAPDEYDVEKHMHLIKPLLGAIAEKHMCLEINANLARKRGNDVRFAYPENRIVELALDMPIRFSYGSDAHAPQNVGAVLDQLEAHPIYGRALARWENE